MKNVKLPDKPSELLRLALADLEKCERSKKYEVNMGTWLCKYGDICYVCLSGAVMAQTLKLEGLKDDYWKSLCKIPEWKKLTALNFLRAGCCSAAFDELGIRVTNPEQFDCDITYYSPKNSAEFKADMRQLAKDLEAAGL